MEYTGEGIVALLSAHGYSGYFSFCRQFFFAFRRGAQSVGNPLRYAAGGTGRARSGETGCDRCGEKYEICREAESDTNPPWSGDLHFGSWSAQREEVNRI